MEADESVQVILVEMVTKGEKSNSYELDVKSLVNLIGASCASFTSQFRFRVTACVLGLPFNKIWPLITELTDSAYSMVGKFKVYPSVNWSALNVVFSGLFLESWYVTKKAYCYFG